MSKSNRLVQLTQDDVEALMLAEIWLRYLHNIANWKPDDINSLTDAEKDSILKAFQGIQELHCKIKEKE